MASPDTDKRSGRLSWILAAIFGSVVVICGTILVIVFATGGGHTNQKTSDRKTTHPSNSAAAKDPDPSVCGLTGYEKTGAVREAPSAKWDPVGGTTAPSDPARGPGKTDANGLRYCFQHTPEGAVFAAANIIAQTTDQSLQKPIVEKMTVPGPGRDKLLEAADRHASEAPGVTPQMQIVAFSLRSYSEKTAVVEIVIRSNNQGQAAATYSLTWSGGDWKQTPSDAGGFKIPPHDVPQLDGYVPWSGNGNA